MEYLHENAIILLSVLAVIEAVIATHLVRRLRMASARMYTAIDAAEDAARAAALAAPGAIDPEVVIDLIRSGKVATLDTIHELMETRAAGEVP